MKNTSTDIQAMWSAQLQSFDRHLKVRGMAEKTRIAYGTDVAQLAEWAVAHELGPLELTPRMLQRFAGVLSERGLGKSSVARKIASIRAFHRQLVQRGDLSANPADLVATPKKDQSLPRVMKPAEAGGVLDSIPASTSLEIRDRALFEIAYGSGLRAEELVNLDVEDLDPDAEELRVTGKGSKTRIVPAGEPTWRAIERYLDRARPRLAAKARGRADPA